MPSVGLPLSLKKLRYKFVVVYSFFFAGWVQNLTFYVFGQGLIFLHGGIQMFQYHLSNTILFSTAFLLKFLFYSISILFNCLHIFKKTD